MNTHNFLKLLVKLYADQNRVKVKHSIARKVSDSNIAHRQGFEKKHQAE